MFMEAINMYKHKIVDTVSGEESVIDLTPTEIAEIEKNLKQSEKEIVAYQNLIAKKQIAVDKLEALGLTKNDLEALGLA